MARIGRPRRRTVGIALAALLAVAVGGCSWFVQPQPLLPEAGASLASTETVVFSAVDGRLEWAPADGAYGVGLIVYPGGRVPAEAYGPLAREIAAGGFLVVVVPMPFNLAVLGIGAARPVIAAHPEVAAWAIGGHSLGGSMAAQYAADDPAIRGLALWASWSATDLSARDLAVLTIAGSLDAGAARMLGPDGLAALPTDATVVEIEGGNHEQMAWYTGQPNDPPASLPRSEQKARVAAATIALLARIAPGG